MMDGRTETRIHSLAGLLLALVTVLAVLVFGAPPVLAFIVPVFGYLAFLVAFESFRDGLAAQLVAALRGRRGAA